MGLDTYFYATDEDNLIRDGDNIISVHDSIHCIQVGYFRNNWVVQSQLTDYWLDLNPDKGSEDFNCSYLEITSGILEDLIETAHHKLKEFGLVTESYDYSTAQELLVICHLIGTLLNSGKKVYYTNWY